jgi:hypothetical protein
MPGAMTATTGFISHPPLQPVATHMLVNFRGGAVPANASTL